MLISIAVAWEVVASLLNNPYLPSPFTVAQKFYQLALDGSLYKNTAASLERVFLGFGLAAICGVGLGIAIGITGRLGRIAGYYAEVMRYVSPISLFPLFILVFGLGLSSKIAMIFWVSWIPVLLSSANGIKNVDPVLIKAAISMGASRGRVITAVMIPSAMSYILAGLRIGMGIAFLGLVTAEMIGANSGLGFMVIQASETFKIADLYVGIIMLSLLGGILNYAFVLLEKSYTRDRGTGLPFEM